jgi:hypothetical protein
MDALADHAESAPDQELLGEASAQGVDANAEAGRVRDLLLGAVLRAKKERLEEAQRAHRQALADLGSRTARLPADPAARRALLLRTVTRKPQMKDAVMTLQHRDFESFSDGDVESALKQLQALGLLDDEFEPKS